ncbi:MAG: DUF4157 domain-containing protein [Nostoc sp. NMS1]|nr:DUF4157 domain-containing protein [Nostoc sp. NMS1]MBN3990952.1 DUF4157 domain-containing protein [Nostoc sp. NMS2]
MQRMAQPVNHQSIQREALPEEEEELQMKPLANSITPLVQREALPEEEEELQMKPMVHQAEAGMAAAPDLEASINQAKGGGQAIADNIREPMEQAFGADFSGVKVHTDGQSDQLNRSIQARAFTTGQDVFFRQGEYNPGSRGGQELIAHELTHVVQQNDNHLSRSSLPHTFHISSVSLPRLQCVFASSGSLSSHFTKHVSVQNDAGAAYANEADYEAAADAIVSDPTSLQKTGGTGKTYYLNQTTGQFVATNSAGKILTMFVPGNPLAYYTKQI